MRPGANSLKSSSNRFSALTDECLFSLSLSPPFKSFIFNLKGMLPGFFFYFGTVFSLKDPNRTYQLSELYGVLLHYQSGHRSRQGTYSKVTQRYWWPGDNIEMWKHLLELTRHVRKENPDKWMRSCTPLVCGEKFGLDVVHMPRNAGFKYLLCRHEGMIFLDGGSKGEKEYGCKNNCSFIVHNVAHLYTVVHNVGGLTIERPEDEYMDQDFSRVWILIALQVYIYIKRERKCHLGDYMCKKNKIRNTQKCHNATLCIDDSDLWNFIHFRISIKWRK